MARKNGELFAGIDHSVIDSAAFADLNGEAIRLLLILARQDNGKNNGHLQAAHTYCSQRGIGSDKTLTKAIASLIAHGFIYRTRSHGLDSQTRKRYPALYALTWLPLSSKRTGLFCSGFVADAYLRWSPEKNKTP